MNLLKIYKFIIKMQELVGDNAEVRLQARDNSLILRVDWWGDDFHAQRAISEIELSQVVDDGLLLDYFVDYCRNARANKKRSQTGMPRYCGECGRECDVICTHCYHVE
jgi:hypothetical protein